MRITTFILFTLILLSCRSQNNQRHFYFASVGWNVSVPAEISMEDSANYYSKMISQRQPPLKDPSATYDSSTSADDSHPGHQAPAGTGYTRYNPAKMLLTLQSPGSQWNLLSSHLIANITKASEIRESGFDEHIRALRTQIADAYSSTSFFSTLVKTDSAFSHEEIGGVNFTKQEFTFHFEKRNQYLVAYSAMIHGYLFEVAINFTNEDDGKKLLDVFRNSEFQ